MNLEYREEQEREDLMRAAARRNKRIRARLAGLGFALLLISIPVLSIICWEWFRGSERSREALSTEVLTEADGTMSERHSYTQAELDLLLSRNAENAQSLGEQKVLEQVREAFSQGKTTVEALRPLYPEDIVVASSGKIHFVPINRSLKQSTLVQDNLQRLDSGELRYVVGDQVVSHKGIDVSSHQGKIDWSLVAQDGVEFAMIRVGFRGYGKEGKLVVDEYFESNIQEARRNGIKVGVYFFSQAINEEELLEEAQLVLDSIAPYRLDCPVVYDVERVSGSNARMNALTVEERTALSLLFCETIEKAGYKPMLYHNTEMGALLLDIAAFEQYDKWYASYNVNLFYPYEFKVWQYSEKGSVNGIKGDVDLNISFEPIWDE